MNSATHAGACHALDAERTAVDDGEAAAEQPASRGITRLFRTRPLADRAWICVESRIDDESLSVVTLAAALNMSRSSLHRKLVATTGQPPGEFIRAVRLHTARRLLREGRCNVSEAAYAVGFVSLSGFSRAYRNYFGDPPSSSRADAA